MLYVETKALPNFLHELFGDNMTRPSNSTHAKEKNHECAFPDLVLILAIWFYGFATVLEVDHSFICHRVSRSLMNVAIMLL